MHAQFDGKIIIIVIITITIITGAAAKTTHKRDRHFQLE
jgi:hypothetical protein